MKVSKIKDEEEVDFQSHGRREKNIGGQKSEVQESSQEED